MRAFTVDYCEQRSPEWFAAHAGLLSASDAAAMMSRLKRSGEEPVGKTELRPVEQIKKLGTELQLRSLAETQRK